MVNFSINSAQVIWSKTLSWGEISFAINNLNEVSFGWANSLTGNKYSTIYSQPNVIQPNEWYDIVVTFENSGFFKRRFSQTNLIFCSGMQKYP